VQERPAIRVPRRPLFRTVAPHAQRQTPGQQNNTRAFASFHTGYQRDRPTRSTNAIESINARYRRAVKARGHDPTGGGRARWMVRWKPALNAFAITFAGRLDRAIH
jgi:transposase-like protein